MRASGLVLSILAAAGCASQRDATVTIDTARSGVAIAPSDIAAIRAPYLPHCSASPADSLRVTSSGLTLLVPIASGDTARFEADTSEIGVNHLYLGRLRTGHHVVRSVYEDGIGVALIDPCNGRSVTAVGDPTLSPSGRLIVTIDPDALGDVMLEVYRVAATGELSIEHQESTASRGWAPRDARWQGDTVVVVSRYYWADSLAKDHRLVRVGQSWRWQPSP